MQVAVEERREALGRLGDFVRSKHLSRDARIRASGDFRFGQIIVDAEAFAEATPQGTFPGAAGSEQSSIDIEEDEFLFQGKNSLAAAWPCGK
jgi:hypothetical protein